MNALFDFLDNQVPGTLIKITADSRTLPQLLKRGDALTILTQTDLADAGIKLISVRHSFHLARVSYQNGILKTKNALTGALNEFTEEEAERLPVSILGNVLRISFN